MPVRRVKYMGGSHVRVLKAGEDFNGRLGTPLPQTVTWGLNNNHVAEVDLPDEALKLLLAEPAAEAGYGDNEFVDVTDSKTVPTSLGQRRWQALPSGDEQEDADEAPPVKEALSPTGVGGAKASGGASAGTTSAPGTATGGTSAP